MRFVTHLSSVLGALVALSSAASSASAGGFSTTRFGGEDGHAATTDVTALFYNPAGLAYGHGTRLYVEGLFAYRTADYTRDAGAIDNPGTGTPTDAIGKNSGKGTLANLIISPFIGVASDLGVKGLGVALGLSVPFGGQASWDKIGTVDPTYPGAVDGPARWASIEGTQRSLYYTLAAAWHTPDRRFAIGAGVNLVSSEINLVRARNLDGTDDLVQANGALKEGRALLDVKGTDLAASVGVQWMPTPCSRIGLAYQSQPGFGQQTLTGTLATQIGATAPGEVPIELRQQLPDAIRAAGEWHAFTNASLHAAVEYQRWSKFKNQCVINPGAPDAECTPDGNGLVPQSGDLNTNIVRNWQDTIGIRVGGTYYASKDLEVTGGVLYDSNAVPDGTLDPALMDMDKLIPQLGVRYRLGRVELRGTAGQVLYFSRTTTPSTTRLPAGDKNRSPDMAGEYHQSVSYAVIGVGVNL
ncbi:MAG: outer membrane protein transport protein [Kofleriaceae bacterium]